MTARAQRVSKDGKRIITSQPPSPEWLGGPQNGRNDGKQNREGQECDLRQKERIDKVRNCKLQGVIF